MRIAVLIPVRNEQRFITEALDTVAAQTRRPDEIIVVDDGSTDSTAGRVCKWSRQRGIEVQLLHQESRGVAAARNHGLRCSRADLVALLDADDLFLPHHLESAEAAFMRYPELALCFADAEVLSQEKILHNSFLADKQFKSTSLEEGEAALRLLDDSPYNSLIGGNFIPVSTSVYRMTKLRLIEFFDETLINAADRDVNLRLSRHGRFAYYPTRSARIRRRANSLCIVDPLRTQRFRFRVVEKMLENKVELQLSDKEIEETFQALSKQASALVGAAANSGWRTYKDAALFLIRNGFPMQACYPPNLLRVARHYVAGGGRSRLKS